MADMGIALLGLGLVYLLSKKKVNGATTVPISTPHIGGYTYSTPGLAKMAVAFEEHLEENKEEIEVYEQTRRRKSVAAGVAPPIPVLTKAIAYRSHLQEKPVEVRTGVYDIR